MVIYQSVTIHCHHSMGQAIGPKTLYCYCCVISSDWLNVKRLHCRHSKIVKWLNQIEPTLWGSPQRGLQKDRMRLHELSYLSKKRQSISIFHKKGKDQIKITKIGNNVMSIVQISIALHCCIQSLHLLHFKIKIACICTPKKKSCSNA